uniref:ThyX n=1 Tax=Geladintestivirus 1 TaxID=3233133 RepID=A0AAU8MI42_9CAUD
METIRLIKPTATAFCQTDFTHKGIYKFIEKCARVCYKSEDNITDDSYLKFVENLLIKGHDRPLEFGTVHLKMNEEKFKLIKRILFENNLWNDIWIKYNIDYDNDTYYITTNYRYIFEIESKLPEIYINKYIVSEDNYYFPKRITVHMILNRATMDSFRTHVTLSHLAESTRYCNYTKDKFGNKITFIIPDWLSIPQGEYNMYLFKTEFDKTIYKLMDTDSNTFIKGDDNKTQMFIESCNIASKNYHNLLTNGCKPQEARDILPLDIKSELISCGFRDAWLNFIDRRKHPTAHPMAHNLAIDIYNNIKPFIDNDYIQ